jgi:two-component system, LytTR family, sensor kinase
MRILKRIFKNDFIQSVCIALSYILLWVPAVFISVDLNLIEFLTAYTSRTWMNIFVAATCLFLFHMLYVFLQKMHFSLLSVIISVLLLVMILTVAYINWLKLGVLINTYPDEERILNNSYVIRSVIYQLYGISYFTIIKLFLRYTKLKSRNQELALEKKTSELIFLKSQTNPHFLFNTLNSIYALARDKSDLTADTVLRLSDILRYMLYETQSEFVSLDKEVEVIENYIELERIRYDETLKIIFEQQIENPEQKIPPLLLIHLIENAFKHGTSQTISQPFISINLTLKKSALLLIVNNSSVVNDVSENLKENIGITNLRRQLSLLFKESNLSVQKTNNSFLVTLEINLNSYAKN